MTDYFSVEIVSNRANEISSLGLAHIGDAVYELLVRTWLCLDGRSTSRGLHRAAISYVSARAQAEAAGKIMPVLSAEEKQVFRRGRNAKVNSVPKNANYEDYHKATGLETLIGYLYLTGERKRINELFTLIMQ